MLVNFIHKLVCFIGFIAAMAIVKWNLGNDKSPNSSPISSNEKKEKKKPIFNNNKNSNDLAIVGVFFFHYHLDFWSWYKEQ